MIIKQYDIGLVESSCKKFAETMKAIKEGGQIKTETKCFIYAILDSYKKLLTKIQNKEITDTSVTEVIPMSLRDIEKLEDIKNTLTAFGKRYNENTFNMEHQYKSFTKILDALVLDYTELFNSYIELRADLNEKSDIYKRDLDRYYRECEREMKRFRNDLLSDAELTLKMPNYEKYLISSDDFFEQSHSSFSDTKKGTTPSEVLSRLLASETKSKSQYSAHPQSQTVKVSTEKVPVLQTYTVQTPVTQTTHVKSHKLCSKSVQTARPQVSSTYTSIDKDLACQQQQTVGVPLSSLKFEKACYANIKNIIFDKSTSCAFESTKQMLDKECNTEQILIIEREDKECNTETIVIKDKGTEACNLYTQQEQLQVPQLQVPLLQGPDEVRIVKLLQKIIPSESKELTSLIQFCEKDMMDRLGGLGITDLLDRINILTDKDKVLDALEVLENQKMQNEVFKLFKQQDAVALAASLKLVKQSLNEININILEKLYTKKSDIKQELSKLKSSSCSLFLSSILSLMLGLILGVSTFSLYKNRCKNKSSNSNKQNTKQTQKQNNKVQNKNKETSTATKNKK